MDMSSGDSLVDLSGHIRLSKLLASVNLVMLITCMTTELGISALARTLLRQILEKNVEENVQENSNDNFSISDTKSISQFLASQPVYVSLVLAPLAIGCVLISLPLFFIPARKLVGSHLLVSGLIWFIAAYYIPKSFFHKE
jgi:hypothetical protein